MSRTTIVLMMAAVLGASALAAPHAAVAGAETCQGRAATIVGHGHGRLQGTPGNDVIVTNGAEFVFAREGDDRVCVTGRYHRQDSPEIEAGPGDDRVKVQVELPGRGTISTDLGPGEDRFWGGPGRDTVDTATGGDHVTTGDGVDVVFSGSQDESNADDLDLGRGDDLVFLRSRDDVDAFIDGGTGADLLRTGDGGDTAAWVFDNTTETATRDGAEALRWNSLEVFDANGLLDLTFRGSDRDERVAVYGNDVDVDLAGGDDEVTVWRLTESADLTLRGGAGSDVFNTFFEPDGLLTADVSTQTVRADAVYPACETIELLLEGFEGFDMTATTVRVTGDARSNRLTAFGCDVILQGGGGDDTLSAKGNGQDDLACLAQTRSELRGGAGDDLLLGWLGDDWLLGGPGIDVARGRAGTDTCRAESTARCELR